MEDYWIFFEKQVEAKLSIIYISTWIHGKNVQFVDNVIVFFFVYMYDEYAY